MNLLENGFGALTYDRWLMFDFFLVVLGVVTNWIMPPITGDLQEDDGGGKNPLMVLRMVRLCRLARMVRLLHTFKGLWTLVQGFMSSLGTMCYTTLILFLVIYGFACLGIELIRNHEAVGKNKEFTEIVDLYFCNLPRIVLTLLQFVAMDSVASIYTPLVIEDGILMFYFFGVILTVAIVLMNIVTAVIVNTAFEAKEVDKEAKKAYDAQIRKSIAQELESMFASFDEDGGNVITQAELEAAPEEAQDLLCELADADTVKEVFDEIDLDGNGELTAEEFVEGVLKIQSSEAPRELRHTEKNFARLFDILTKIEKHLVDQSEKLQSDLDTRLIRMEEKFDKSIKTMISAQGGQKGEEVKVKEEKMTRFEQPPPVDTAKYSGKIPPPYVYSDKMPPPYASHLINSLADICSCADKLRASLIFAPQEPDMETTQVIAEAPQSAAAGVMPNKEGSSRAVIGAASSNLASEVAATSLQSPVAVRAKAASSNLTSEVVVSSLQAPVPVRAQPPDSLDQFAESEPLSSESITVHGRKPAKRKLKVKKRDPNQSGVTTALPDAQPEQLGFPRLGSLNGGLTDSGFLETVASNSPRDDRE